MADAQAATVAQRRRVAEVRAREHVGAAGWSQTRTLEAILQAGREGLIATDTLRQVISLTTEQMRLLPLGASGDEREEHAQALRQIILSGESQLTGAQALDLLVTEALCEITRTPVQDVSVGGLRRVQERLREQVSALHTIIASAQAQAQTLEEVGALERLSAEHQEKIRALRELSAQEEAQALGDAGEQIVERISQLDDAPPQQLGALTRIGEAVMDKMEETGASAADQAQALERLAQAMQEKAEEVRRP